MPVQMSLHYYSALAAPGWQAGPGPPSAAAPELLLSEPLAVRPLGMAGAFAATADDESSISINPAGLARVQGIGLEGGQLIGLLGLEVSHLSLAASLAPDVVLGAQAAYLYDSDTTRDAFGNEGGSFNNSNLLGGIALGAQILPGWRLGAGIKGLEENYAGSTSASVAGDLGVQGPIWHSFRFGAMVQNLGASLNGLGSLPLQIQGGVSLPFFLDDWRIDAEAQALPAAGQVRGLLGTELQLDLGDTAADGTLPMRASLRAGLASPPHSSASPRASAWARAWPCPPPTRLTTPSSPVGDLGATQLLSLSLHFPGQALFPLKAESPGRALRIEDVR